MSSAQKKFFIIANKIIGPKLFRTPSTVKKYQQIYQKDLTVETFLTEQEAFTRLNFLRTEHDRLLQLEDVHSNRKKEEQKDKVIHEMGKEETETKENKEKKNEFNIFYFLKENEELLKTAQQKIDPHQIYHMFFDGASKFNPGPSGCGYAFYTEKSEKIYYNSLSVGIKTNNQAEYYGLIYGLKSAYNLGITKLNCYGDSQLIIKQMNGNFQVKSKSLYYLFNNANKLKKNFYPIKFSFISREENTVADRLANEGKFKRE